MADFVFRANNTPFESLYVTWEELGFNADDFRGGGLWAWGRNNFGQLGLGDTTNRSSPVQVGTLTNWTQTSAGLYHSAAVRLDGTLWTWGNNSNYGPLGLNDTTNRSSPVQVGTATSWRNVVAGRSITLAITRNGTLWAWGRNNLGQLGQGNLVHRSSPVQVGSLTNWKQVSCTIYSVSAVKTDGTLWAWGNNGSGQLGLGDIVHRSSPVQVGSLTNWSQVFAGSTFTVAIKTDGSLWGWGDNSNSQLGGGVTRSSPAQIGSLTNWKQVSGAASAGVTLAVKTNGTLWSWGRNNIGEFGTGVSGVTASNSPVQVGTLTNWKQVGAGKSTTAAHSVLAVKTDGTLWAWGYNGIFGRLGLGDTTNRSSPVQVGSLTNWKQVDAWDHTLALTRT